MARDGSALEFAGEALGLNDDDYRRAAGRLGCDEAAIRAVAQVESGGAGFLSDKRPKVLFESRWFHKLTNGAYDGSHPQISTGTWVRNYAGGAGEYRRLTEAIQLDRQAALKSASWGRFQILGVNHKVVGFPDVESFVEAEMVSEGKQLDAFAEFVLSNHLADELRDRRWTDFALGYNGPSSAQNNYDRKLAEAYSKFAEMGRGPTTREIQQALNRHGAGLTDDGLPGPATRNAIRQFQRDTGLPITGQADGATLSALGFHDPIAMSAAIN